MKIGFIGAGNMARAIIAGWLDKKVVAANNIFIHSAHIDRYEPYAKKNGLIACSSNIEVVEHSDIVFLAVKPIILGKVLAEIKETVQMKKPLLVSMAASTSLTDIENEITDSSLEIIRIMPNVNVEIGAGMTAIVGNQNVSEKNLTICERLFASEGKVALIEEKDFSIFSAIAGSSPAFVYFFIDAMARAGVKYGLKKQQATKIAAQTVLGSAQKVLLSDKTPFEMIDEVCSPGGTTIAGLLAMEEAGFMNAVVKGIDATVAKDQGK